MTRGPGSAIHSGSRRLQRIIGILAVVTACSLAAVIGGRAWFLGTITTDWRTIRADADHALAKGIRAHVDARAGEAQAVARDIAHEATRIMSEHDQQISILRTLDLKPRLTEEIPFAEVRDSTGRVLTYEGRPLRMQPRNQPNATPHMEFVASPPFLVLVAVTPIQTRDGRIAGTVCVGLPLHSDLPQNNRFARTNGLTDVLARSLGTEITVDSTNDAALTDGRLLAVPLTDLRDTLAYAIVPRTTPDAYAQRVGGYFDVVASILLVVLLALLGAIGWHAAATIANPWLSAAVASVILWCSRAALLAASVAEHLAPERMRNPAYFASSFGWGLASSPAELTLTVLAFSGMALLFERARRISNNTAHTLDSEVTSAASASERTAIITTAIVLLLLPFAVRGYAAAMRSFVSDSSVSFDSIGSLAAHPMLVLMLTNSVLFTFATLILLRASAASCMQRSRASAAPLRIAACGAATVTGLALFFITTNETLLGPVVYILTSGVLAVSSVAGARMDARRLPSPWRWTMLAAACALVAGACTFRFSDEKRRAEVEAIAVEISQPVDAWSRALVERALQSMAFGPASTHTAEALRDVTGYQSAFRLWSASPLSSQPNNAAVCVFGADGALRSRFIVGLDPALLDTDTLAHVEDVREIPTPAGRATGRMLYAGAITPPTSPMLRVVVVLESVDRTERQRSGVDLLRTSPSIRSHSPEDRFVVRVFRGGPVMLASDPDTRKDLTLPANVREAFAHGSDRMWDDAPAGSGIAPTFYIRGADASEVISISIGTSDTLFTIYRWLRLLLLCIACAAVLGGVHHLERGTFAQLRGLRFATRLQLAFAGIAAIPVLLLWLAARSWVTSTDERALSTRLQDDLDMLVRMTETMPSTGASGAPHIPNDEDCRRITASTGREINVYASEMLAATSRPELYATGLLSPRMPHDAWRALAFEQRDRIVVHETVGAFPYLTGYRALRDRGGALRAIISTPTLFQTNRAEEEYTRGSATILLGVFLILLVVLPVSAVLARQISRPLAALTEATHDIAAGDLDRTVTVRGAREFGELTASFNSMTRQLRASREDLAAAERDLAWKEMARQVAHEIRNPLTPMKLAAQHLRRAWDDGAKNIGDIIVRVTGTIIDQIETLARISDEFSRFGRMPRRSLANVQLSQVLEEAVALFRHHHEIAFTLEAAGLPPVTADREELGRAFTNILRNAVQAIADAGDIRITASADAETVHVDVHDTGCGIPEAELPRIFEPSFSTKSDGMGLGLAIVRKIIEDLGGRVSIESIEGTGTTVHVVLPRSVSPASPALSQDGASS